MCICPCRESDCDQGAGEEGGQAPPGAGGEGGQAPEGRAAQRPDADGGAAGLGTGPRPTDHGGRLVAHQVRGPQGCTGMVNESFPSFLKYRKYPN